MTGRMWRTSLALSLTAVTTLMLELQLMRIFDAILQPNMAYMVITGAMFAFGLSGAYATLWPRSADSDVGRFLAKLAVGFSVFALLLLPIVNLLPFDPNRLGDDTVRQMLLFGVLYLALLIPFFLAGLIFTTVFSSYSSQIRSLYFFDLCGAALGCVIFIPLIPLIGPGGLIFTVAALNVVAAILFARPARLLSGIGYAVAFVVLCIPFLKTDGYYDFKEKFDKRGVLMAREEGDVVLTRWDPIAKIDVIKSYAVDKSSGQKVLKNYHVAYDGGNQSSRLYPFDGDFRALREEFDADLTGIPDHFWNRTVIASHWLKADSNAEVLVIGSAAGQETKAALLFNPKSVDAVEMVRAVVNLSQGQFGDYIGNIFRDPRVNVQVGEGRTFLRSNNKKFDIIQIFSNHTSSSMAAGTGVASPVYLQTVEAYVEYFSSLKSDGILQINHHVYPRMIAAAAAAWKQLGRSDFRRHVVVYEQKPWDNIPLVMFKMTPWSDAEFNRLDEFMNRPGNAELDQYFVAENPVQPQRSFLSDEFYSGTLSEETIAAVPYRVRPATDNQPFFSFLRRHFGDIEPQPFVYLNSATAALLNSQLSGTKRIPMDVAHWFVTAAAAMFFALTCVLVPLLFSTAGRSRWPGEFTSLFYFSCLGAGFIIVELTLIQIFMKFVGYPLYTYSLVLFTMLLAAGLGSRAAESLEISPLRRAWVPFAGIFAFGTIFWSSYSFLFDQFLSQDLPLRIVIAALMMFPVSFFMGMALPLGILAIEKKPRGAIAWAWGMNGLFTTIGGIASGLIAIFFGFKATLAVAILIYVFAALAFRRLARLSDVEVSTAA